MAYSHKKQIHGLIDQLYGILDEVTQRCAFVCPKEEDAVLKRELTMIAKESERVAKLARSYRKQIFGG